MKRRKIFLVILCIISFTRCFLLCINYNYIYKEINLKVKGKVTNIIRYEDKTIFDIYENKKYRITTYNKFNYELGDILLVEGNFHTASSNTTPGLFNYHKYLLSKNIKLISNEVSIKLLSKNTNILYKIKNYMIKKIDKYETKKYLRLFLMGDNTDLDDEIKNTYRNIGISHLFSISGMHVSLFLVLFNFIFKKSKFKKILIIIFLFFLLFITNFSNSLLRCVLFTLLKYFNNITKLNIKNTYLLIITAAIILLFNPYMIYSVGFLFSTIITFYILLSKKLLVKNKKYFKKLFLISFICFLSSIPILSLYFFKVNLLSIIYNLIFVPIVSFVIFPLSLITFTFLFFDKIYLIIINIFESTALFISNVDYFSVVISKPNIFVIILYYIILYISIKKDKRYLIIFIAVLMININSKYFINNARVTFLDVGQGDSSLIIFPKGKTALIDTGGKLMSNYSIAKNTIIPYLNSKGINEIKYLILTHGDYDHMGEAINLVNNFKVENVIFNNDSYNDLEKKLIKVLDRKKIKHYKGLSELNISDNKLYFLNTKNYNDENENSSVIYTEIDNIKILLMGDSGIKREKDIIQKYNLENIDILKVGHHGSNTSSSKYFIDNINPKNCLISVGKNNRYGHPKDSVLDTLDDYCNIYRTDTNGSVEIKFKNNNYKIKTVSPKGGK